MASQNINRPENVFTMIEDWMLNEAGAPSREERNAAYIERITREERDRDFASQAAEQAQLMGAEEPRHWDERRQLLNNPSQLISQSPLGQSLSELQLLEGRGLERFGYAKGHLQTAWDKYGDLLRSGYETVQPPPSTDPTGFTSRERELGVGRVGSSPVLQTLQKYIGQPVSRVGETYTKRHDAAKEMVETLAAIPSNVQKTILAKIENIEGDASIIGKNAKRVVEETVKDATVEVSKLTDKIIEVGKAIAKGPKTGILSGDLSDAAKSIDFNVGIPENTFGSPDPNYQPRFSRVADQAVAEGRFPATEQFDPSAPGQSIFNIVRDLAGAGTNVLRNIDAQGNNPVKNLVEDYIRGGSFDRQLTGPNQGDFRDFGTGADRTVVAARDARNQAEAKDAESLNKSINLRQSVTDGLRAGMTVGNLRDEKQYRGVMDAVIGEQMSDKIRNAIGWDSPVWQAPDTGIIGLLQNMMTNPMASAPGVSGWGQIGYAGDAQRTRAAAGALAASEARSKAITAEAAQRTSMRVPDLTGPNLKMIEGYGTAGNMLEVIDAYRTLITNVSVTGGDAAIADALTKISRIVGLDIGATRKEQAKNLVQHLQESFTGLYGEQVNKAEFKALESFLNKFGWGDQILGSDDAILTTLTTLENKLTRDRRNWSSIADTQGLNVHIQGLDRVASLGSGSSLTPQGRAQDRGDLITSMSDRNNG